MAARAVNAKRHAARRDEFIDSGRRLIQSRGYEQFSIEDLLREVGASKGAFYHYFDSKPALLEAIVERLVSAVMAGASEVVARTNLTAIDKLRAYFGTIAALETEQKDFLEALMRVWYTDDNAIVREKLRRETVRLVTPLLAEIIRQGIAEGVFTLTDPDQMARVVLALILDAGDEAGELYLRHQTGEVTLDDARSRLATYSLAIERVLGLAPGSLQLINEPTLRTWFE